MKVTLDTYKPKLPHGWAKGELQVELTSTADYHGTMVTLTFGDTSSTLEAHHLKNALLALT